MISGLYGSHMGIIGRGHMVDVRAPELGQCFQYRFDPDNHSWWWFGTKKGTREFHEGQFKIHWILSFLLALGKIQIRKGVNSGNAIRLIWFYKSSNGLHEIEMGTKRGVHGLHHPTNALYSGVSHSKSQHNFLSSMKNVNFSHRVKYSIFTRNGTF